MESMGSELLVRNLNENNINDIKSITLTPLIRVLYFSLV